MSEVAKNPSTLNVNSCHPPEDEKHLLEICYLSMGQSGDMPAETSMLSPLWPQLQHLHPRTTSSLTETHTNSTRHQDLWTIAGLFFSAVDKVRPRKTYKCKCK